MESFLICEVEMKIGDRVRIRDYSEAHGDTGSILHIQENGVIIVALDADTEKEIFEGTCWPVMETAELELIVGR